MNPTLLDHLARNPPSEWLPPQTVEEGALAVEQKRVSRPKLGAHVAAAYVADDRRGRCRATLRLGADGLVASCSCGAQGCPHVAALALMLVGEALPEAPADRPGGPTREDEHARRSERAQSGLFRVRAAEPGALFGRYFVASPSGREYEVRLRALDAPHNGCTCLDFATNLLGTCKHIEAVLASLARRRGGRRAFAAARLAPPPGSYLYLAHEPATGVRLRLAPRDLPAARFARRWFDGDGRPAVQPLDAWPEALAEAARAGLEVPAEVERWVERSLQAAARARRQAAVEAEVRRGGGRQPGFAGTLYPYQVEGVAFLASRGRALLADDMGLGKTAQAIAAMARLFSSREIARALVVCPASLKHQWAQEIARFVALPGVGVTVVGGTLAQRREQYQSAREVVVTSYELLRADEAEVSRLGPELLVLDEAQRIKNWRTRTSDVVKRVPCRLAYVLTGTPLENRLDDLYSLMQVVDPHLLGPLWRFNQDFTSLDDTGRVVGYRNLGELRARMAPVVLRRRKEEVLQQLPERLVTRMSVTLDPRQRTAHDDHEGTAGRLLAILARRPLTPVEEQRLMRAFQGMRMACDAACLVDRDATDTRSPKLDELERLLEEICVQGGHKVVVFSEWERMQQLAAGVAERLRLGHVRLHGGVPTAKRGALIQKFREDPACKVFFSTDAGGVGLNLQAADHLINLDLPWNPAVLSQRIGRVHRLGQKNAVNVVLLVAEESIETRMEGTLQAKRGLFEATVGEDVETEALERTGLAKRLSTLLTQGFAAGTGGPPTAPERPDPVQSLRERLGDGLAQLVKTREGRLVAVLAEGAQPPALEACGEVLVVPAGAAQALEAFGAASPLQGAQVLFAREPVAPADPEALRRVAQLAAAERKLTGARVLSAQSLGAEALGLVRDGLALLCRAAAPRDPGEEPAALLGAVFGELVPKGVLGAAEAAALARAGELARAFGGASVAPPEPLVTCLLDEAAGLAKRLSGTRA